MKQIDHTTSISRIMSIFWYGVFALGLLVAGVFVMVKYTTDQYIVRTIKEAPTVHTAIVLGAALAPNGALSMVFQDRVDTAIALYRAGKVSKILVTGDDGSRSHNEVNPARDYLLTQGVPSDVIFLDHAGFDTYSSMYRAEKVFLVDTAIIVTQEFHLPRAIFIARRLGMSAYGVVADKRKYYLSNSVRELFADVKAVFNLATHRVPKYLGDPIPITGSSSASI